MKTRIAFIGADENDLKFIEFISHMPNYEIALIADERKDSAGMKYAKENQIRTAFSFSDAIRFQDIDVFAVLTPGVDIVRHLPQAEMSEKTFIDRKQFQFIYNTVWSLMSSEYLEIEHHLLNNTKEIQKAISDFGIITKNIDILAINASIEAARAGESGKGFAVVASNIKDLVKSSREMLLHIKLILEKFTKTHQQMIEIRTSLSEDRPDSMESD